MLRQTASFSLSADAIAYFCVKRVLVNQGVKMSLLYYLNAGPTL